jgi:lipid A 3-O-deacylase
VTGSFLTLCGALGDCLTCWGGRWRQVVSAYLVGIVARVSRTCWGVLVALLAMAATDGAFAQSHDGWRSRSIVDEIRLGVYGHHIEPSGTEQGGLDVNAEVLFAKPVEPQDRGSLHSFLMPRIHIGTQINVDGDTSQLYAGLTWDLRFSFEVTFGGAVHDGPTNGEGSSFGCVANFRESGSIGVGLTERLWLYATVAHMSNAGLCDRNSGLTSGGLRLGYMFN